MYMNAQQGVDAAVGAFDSAFAVLANNIREWREAKDAIAETDYYNQLNKYKFLSDEYLKIIEKSERAHLQTHSAYENLHKDYMKMRALAIKLEDELNELKKQHAKTTRAHEVEKKISADKTVIISDYIMSVGEKLVKINEYINKLSGKSLAYEKMNERLMEEMRALSSDNALITNPEAYRKQLEEDWNHFMETQEVKKFTYVDLIMRERKLEIPPVE